MSKETAFHPVQIFVSHTKFDSDFCDRFDIAASREGVRIFRSELEDIANPPWIRIKDAIDESSALFLLVGKKLVEMQARSETNLESKDKWKFTQNWIAFEIGLACHRGIDVWVWCDDVAINFPVPYLNNYHVWGVRKIDKDSLKFVRSVFQEYKRNSPFPLHSFTPDCAYECPSCGAVFNIASQLPAGMIIPCPSCLANMKFPKGWVPDADM